MDLAPSNSGALSVASRGRTTVSDEVISVIARIAAEDVAGVHKIAQPSLQGMIGRLGRHAGVAAEVGYLETAIDVSIVIEYGQPILKVAEEIRSKVIAAVEGMTGKKVVEVNVDVHDVHIPKSTKATKRTLE